MRTPINFEFVSVLKNEKCNTKSIGVQNFLDALTARLPAALEMGGPYELMGGK